MFGSPTERSVVVAIFSATLNVGFDFSQAPARRIAKLQGLGKDAAIDVSIYAGARALEHFDERGNPDEAVLVGVCRVHFDLLVRCRKEVGLLPGRRKRLETIWERKSKNSHALYCLAEHAVAEDDHTGMMERSMQ